MPHVDLNADLGESFGPYKIGSDDAILPIITSANVACGFHGGDPVVMRRTVERAQANGVAVGAHPGLNDLWGFGRRRIEIKDMDELEAMLIYQIGALQGVARAQGQELAHVKLHGALSNMAAENLDLANAAARAIKAVAPQLFFVVLPNSELEVAGEAHGLRLAREIFADRGYDDNAMLVRRGTPGAMIEDAEEAADRIVRFVRNGAIESLSGKRIEVPIDTICVHGDGPAAVAMAQAIRNKLADAGITIAPFSKTLG